MQNKIPVSKSKRTHLQMDSMVMTLKSRGLIPTIEKTMRVQMIKEREEVLVLLQGRKQREASRLLFSDHLQLIKD